MAFPQVSLSSAVGYISWVVVQWSPLDIYFHQRNADEHHAALELRDAVLRLRRDGAFIAVPLFRVNTDPIGPHPVGMWQYLQYVHPRSILTQEFPRLVWDLVSFGVVRLCILIPLHEPRRLKVQHEVSLNWKKCAHKNSILVHPLTREEVCGIMIFLGDVSDCTYSTRESWLKSPS